MSSSEIKTKRCSRCKLTKPLEDFGVDKSKPSGRTAWCLACKRRYNDDYYNANAEELIAAELARREGKPPVKGQRIASKRISLKFEPSEMRQVIAAYVKPYNVEPTDQQLEEYLVRYARAGVLGQAKYILERK